MTTFLKWIKKNSTSLRTMWVIGVIVCIVFLGILLKIFLAKPVVVLETPPPDALYTRASESIPARVEDVLSRMTLEEKIAQMALVEKNSIVDMQDISTYGIGALLSGAGAKPDDNTVKGWKNMVSGFNEKALESRLGIPLLYGVDAVHGHSGVLGATVFPHSIGLGATGNAELVEKIARATSEEIRATGIYWSYSPNLDVPQDIRWGRTYETFSDDPKLVQKLGSAYVRGLQYREGGDTTTLQLIATAKHYIGLGGMVWGSSSNDDYKIDQGATPANEILLRTVYLPPFAEAVSSGVQSVMVGLNTWGGTKIAGEKYLITEVLKGELGFTGFVVSDWYGVYEIPGVDYTAAVKAINAGVDMVMLPFDYKPFIKNVTRAVHNGDIEESRINDAVRRILTAKFALGLFDSEEKGDSSPSVFGSLEHRALARQAVSESLVLLKNRDSVLPIKSTVTHIRIAGSSADNVGRQSGAWTVEWQGVEGNWLPESTSILSGIRSRAGEDVRVEYEVDGNFIPSIEKADLGIAVVGEGPYAEGVGDNENPTLSAEDLLTIERLTATSKKVVVILVTGRPLFITDEIGAWDGLVTAWLPGSEGVGVADVLFGDIPFTGRLPLTWPRHLDQLPIAPDGSTKDNSAPLFPRYFGLY